MVCRNVGSRWALEQAKYNLLNEYLLVGVTEELEDFIMILEAALPRFFKGATELYRTGRNTTIILQPLAPALNACQTYSCNSRAASGFYPVFLFHSFSLILMSTIQQFFPQRRSKLERSVFELKLQSDRH